MGETEKTQLVCDLRYIIVQKVWEERHKVIKLIQSYTQIIHNLWGHVVGTIEKITINGKRSHRIKQIFGEKLKKQDVF